MTHTIFVAFSSADQFVSDVIGAACKAASSPEAEFIPWNRNDASGQPIDRSVFSWVETADALVADISEPNHNVTYEVGLALGTQKSLRLIRAANKDRKLLEEIGLLHNIGHDDFSGATAARGYIAQAVHESTMAAGKAEHRNTGLRPPLLSNRRSPPAHPQRRQKNLANAISQLQSAGNRPSDCNRGLRPGPSIVRCHCDLARYISAGSIPPEPTSGVIRPPDL